MRMQDNAAVSGVTDLSASLWMRPTMSSHCNAAISMACETTSVVVSCTDGSRNAGTKPWSTSAVAIEAMILPWVSSLMMGRRPLKYSRAVFFSSAATSS